MRVSNLWDRRWRGVGSRWRRWQGVAAAVVSVLGMFLEVLLNASISTFQTTLPRQKGVSSRVALLREAVLAVLVPSFVIEIVRSVVRAGAYARNGAVVVDGDPLPPCFIRRLGPVGFDVTRHFLRTCSMWRRVMSNTTVRGYWSKGGDVSGGRERGG